MMFFPLASFEDVFPFMIPIVIFMIPIVAILTAHQQKMAQIIHGVQKNQPPNSEIESLRREVRELKELVHQQTIAIDGSRQKPLPAEPISQRLTEV